MKHTGLATTIDNNHNDPCYKAKVLCYCTLGCQTMRHCSVVVFPAGHHRWQRNTGFCLLVRLLALCYTWNNGNLNFWHNAGVALFLNNAHIFRFLAVNFNRS